MPLSDLETKVTIVDRGIRLEFAGGTVVTLSVEAADRLREQLKAQVLFFHMNHT